MNGVTSSDSCPRVAVVSFLRLCLEGNPRFVRFSFQNVLVLQFLWWENAVGKVRLGLG